MSQKIPLEQLRNWEVTRSKGFWRFVLRFALGGTTFCWALLYGGFRVGRLLGVHDFGIWIAAIFWISPFVMLGLAISLWKGLEKSYRDALETQRLAMEQAAGRGPPPARIVSTAEPIPTWWTCGSPTRVATRI